MDKDKVLGRHNAYIKVQ